MSFLITPNGRKSLNESRGEENLRPDYRDTDHIEDLHDSMRIHAAKLPKQHPEKAHLNAAADALLRILHQRSDYMR